MVMEVINVHYHTHHVGAVSFDAETGLGAFEYAGAFISTGIQLSPIKMPLAKHIYTYPNLAYATYKGLPGLLADSLPDDFGNAVLNAWVASRGKKPSDITPLQRLQYTGKRGMGALDYVPAMVLEGQHTVEQLDIEFAARNHDDHAKNTAFMLNEDHQWQLAPAYDVVYSYKPGSRWVNQHWMSLNGKREQFTRDDLYSLEALSPLFTRKKVNHIIDETITQVARWRTLAVEHAVPRVLIDRIEENLRLDL